MNQQIAADTPFMLSAAFMALAEQNQRASAHTPITVKVTDAEGAVGDPGEPLYYAVASVEYDSQRNEYVLTINESRQAPGECQYTMSHTQHFCGNPRCRER